MILPVGGFGDFGGRRALLPAQKIEDDNLFGVGAWFRFWPGCLLAGGLRDAHFGCADFGVLLAAG
jgi:hypothetical protein